MKRFKFIFAALACLFCTVFAFSGCNNNATAEYVENSFEYYLSTYYKGQQYFSCNFTVKVNCSGRYKAEFELCGTSNSANSGIWVLEFEKEFTAKKPQGYVYYHDTVSAARETLKIQLVKVKITKIGGYKSIGDYEAIAIALGIASAGMLATIIALFVLEKKGSRK